MLFDGIREMREAFTIHLKPDENMVAETQVSNAFILFIITFLLSQLICRDLQIVSMKRCKVVFIQVSPCKD